MWKPWCIVFLSFIVRGYGCPSGYVKFAGNQKCYGIVKSPKTWASAMEHCNAVGGNLPHIKDANQQAFLASLIASRYYGPEYDISTGNDYRYHYIINDGIDVIGKTSVTFKVMACNDAHIALSQDNGVDTKNTYEIVIGGWGNTQSVIRDCKQCHHMAINKQRLLDCHKFAPFWISWTKNIIKVGKGNVVGKQVFLSWNDPSAHGVNYVAFATGWGATGKWEVKKGPEYDISTGNDYRYHYIINYGIDVIGKTSVTFQVMACNDAHIALSQDNGVDTKNTYEIVIGGWGNTQSVIRDCKQCHHMAINKQRLLDCHKFAPFWISWIKNIIKVGKGNVVGKQVFLSWNDPSAHGVNYVAFATGWGATGKWEVKKEEYNSELFWIGGTAFESESNWLWFPKKQPFKYSNWAPAEPDDTESCEPCALMDAHRGYRWAVDDCEEQRNFLCET